MNNELILFIFQVENRLGWSVLVDILHTLFYLLQHVFNTCHVVFEIWTTFLNLLKLELL